MIVHADPERLSQVLVNLLSNAIKYSPSGTPVKVSATSEGKWVTFRVTDKGRGVPPEHIERIFEKFHQTEITDAKLLGGTGLGLAICKSIVQAHRGLIGVQSTVGQGSTFWFKIPC